MLAVINRYYDIQKMRIQTENELRAIQQGQAVGDEDFIQDVLLIQLMKLEKDIYKQCLSEVKEQPIYQEFLKDIKGIGPILAAGLISIIQKPERFDTVSKLWAYAGLHVIEGKAARRKKGQQSNWNTNLKTLCWKVGESFVKTKGRYRELYDQFRVYYDTKFPEESLGHRYAMAKRKTVKLFLSHLWVTWMELEGLKPTKPYVFDKLGHSTYISP